jgi:S1-C subfamily serine protease
VTLTSVTAGGPADQVGIRAGDVILAIDDHYVFTVGELKEEISHHQPGTKIEVRYRRYSIIYDTPVVLGRGQ